MTKITTIKDLETLYGTAGEVAAKTKVATQLTPAYRAWIMASRFCVLSTVGKHSTNGSPRGDIGPVVTELDPKTLAMPDWRGNNRLDCLRDIITDGRASLMFMVPGSQEVVRINGHAELRVDADLIAQFSDKGRLPKTVILMHIDEIYIQCAKALMRSDLWSGVTPEVPSIGDILTEMSAGNVDGADFDERWPEVAKETMF